jgi:hypothetical protein
MRLADFISACQRGFAEALQGQPLERYLVPIKAVETADLLRKRTGNPADQTFPAQRSP